MEGGLWVAGIVWVVSGLREGLWLLSCCFGGLGFGGLPSCGMSHGGHGGDMSDLSIVTEVVIASEPAQSVTASLSSDFDLTEFAGLWPVHAVASASPNCFDGSSDDEVDFNVS